jgi:hypothetical protein
MICQSPRGPDPPEESDTPRVAAQPLEPRIDPEVHHRGIAIGASAIEERERRLDVAGCAVGESARAPGMRGSRDWSFSHDEAAALRVRSPNARNTRAPQPTTNDYRFLPSSIER